MGEQPFRPVGEDRYGGGRKERSGGSTSETKKTGASEAKTPSHGHETPVPKYVEGTIKELEKSDPGKAEELRDYLNGVTDAATDLLNADRIGNAFAYADVLAVLGGRIAPAMLGERDPVNSGDSQVDARLRRETTSVMQVFERIGRKLFPEVVKPRNATESKKLLDQVVADLSKIEVGAKAFYGMDKIDWSSSAPADMIWELQTRSEQLSETMFNVTNVESIDETRGFGVPRPADMVVMGRALFSVKGVIEQIKISEYGRSDVTAEEMAAMDAVKGKIGGAGSPVDRTLGSRARAARERLRSASMRETELDGGVDNGENSVEQSQIAHAHFDALLVDTSVDAIQAEIRRLEKKNAGLSPDANAAARDAELLLKMLPDYAKRLTDSERNKQRGKAGRQVSQSGESPRVTQGLIDLIKVSPLNSWSDTIKQVANPDLKRLLKKLEAAVES